jgi:hypothetical protein
VKRVLAATALAASLAACGDATVVVAPKRVDPALAPADLPDGLKLYENTSESTRRALANVGEGALMADGRVWEIRRADRLIGTLQVSTVMPRFDLTDGAVRDGMVRQIIPQGASRIRVQGIEVHVSEDEDRAIFLWFGDGVFEVLQLKDRELEFESVVAAILGHQRKVPSWRPLTDLVGTDEDEEADRE